MIIDDAAGAEKLNVAQFAAQFRQEAEAEIHVLGRLRQTRPHHQHPAGHGRGNEQFVLASFGQSFLPRTRRRAIEVKGGLHHRRIIGLDSEPSARLLERGGTERIGPGEMPAAGSTAIRN